MGRRTKIRLNDTIARVIFLEEGATEGARLGTNVFLPNGQVATPTTLREYLGVATAQGGTTRVAHSTLVGLTADDHPQYVRGAILTTQGDLLLRGESAVERLAVGNEDDVLTVVAGEPTWAPGTGFNADTILTADGEVLIDGDGNVLVET